MSAQREWSAEGSYQPLAPSRAHGLHLFEAAFPEGQGRRGAEQAGWGWLDEQVSLGWGLGVLVFLVKILKALQACLGGRASVVALTTEASRSPRKMRLGSRGSHAPSRELDGSFTFKDYKRTLPAPGC